MNDLDTISKNIVHAEPARLIPTVADSAKEQRAISVLLATMSAVGEFGRTLLRRTEAPTGKKARIRCFTEVTFKGPDGSARPRPDGMIVVTQGGKNFSLLVEGKVGRETLDATQIETYLTLARENELDGIVTISNQFGGGTTDIPIQVDARKMRRVAVHHIPWRALVADATLLCNNEQIEDTDQAFLLREMVRYFTHESSGVIGFKQMGQNWKDICFAFQQSTSLARDSAPVRDTVSDWLDLSYFVSIELGLAIGRSVSIHVPRDHADAPAKRSADHAQRLVQEGKLSSEFVVPDAASRIQLTADFARRSLNASMTVKAPADVARATTSITWILKQLADCKQSEVIVRAKWPGRAQDTVAALDALRENRALLLQSGAEGIPTAFEISLARDLGQKFKSPRSFVEETEGLIVTFYAAVGQFLRSWIPAPPSVPVSATVIPDSPDPSPAVAVEPTDNAPPATTHTSTLPDSVSQS
jgi:hypothetical protein